MGLRVRNMVSIMWGKIIANKEKKRKSPCGGMVLELGWLDVQVQAALLLTLDVPGTHKGRMCKNEYDAILVHYQYCMCVLHVRAFHKLILSLS